MKYDSASDIPLAVVEKTREAKGYQALARAHARKKNVTVGELTDDDWREVYFEKSRRRTEYYRKVQIPDRVGVALEEAHSPQQEDADIAEYLEYYENPAPNDLLTIKQLVSMQHQLRTVEDQVAITLDDEVVNVGRWRDLVQIQQRLSQETRLLQETLGISRKVRESKRHEQEVADLLMENIEQAKELLDELGVKIVCPHCRGNTGQTILQGFAIHHFPEMGLTISTRCPSCQREFSVEKAPTQWIRRPVIPL